MSVYTIADLHLSTYEKTNKSMEVFGKRWDGYMTRIEGNWRHLVTDADTVIIPGDVSWALSLEEAESDLKLLDSLPGTKILGKGNHDFWWATMRKHEIFFEKVGISSIKFLFNNAHDVGEVIVAGTRGWYLEEDAKNAPDNADFEKLIARERLRLKTSLDAAVKLKGDTDKPIVAFMHFPPYYNEKESEGLCDLLIEYGVRDVYYGHIHGNYTIPPVTSYRGLNFHIISADYIGFIPKIVK
ncbi:MAG: metallophosphoesterase [Clostridia bacterium]|nr:metallophosphoesterase [Clostridia bacterium]